MCLWPLFGEVQQIQVGSAASAPVEGDCALRLFSDGVFDNGFDRCKAGAAGDQQHRLFRVFAQEEATMRTIDTQQVAFFQAVENVFGEFSTRNQADM